ATTEITANVTSVKERITRMTSSINEVSDSMNSIKDSIFHINEDITNQSSAVEESGAAITEMVASMDNMEKLSQLRKGNAENLMAVTKSGGEKLKETKNIITEIVKSVDSIVSMVELINNISAQTNLLSMNAAIEAAHAGDSGKGFSVVAEEIRKLADNSGVNAKKIDQELKTIVTKIENAAHSSEETETAFTAIQEEVSEVSLSMEELLSSTKEMAQGGRQIREATDMISQITIKVKEQSDSISDKSETLAGSLNEINLVSAEVSGSMDEITSGTQLINDSMVIVNDMAQGNLKLAVSELDEEVGSFYTGEEQHEIEDDVE
ncbi:MAG: methyl-accepting chemotaxis protein, partial [Spirochaetales bacterium]|nr:methyl-accepting chemotaxis protein [Spirochaetales bacterium]